TAEIHGHELKIRVPFETSPPKNLRGLIVLGHSATDENRIGWYVGDAGDEDIAITTPVSVPAITRGVWTFLFFGFIGGFILNLMPCVLPVISLKIFGFV